MLIGSESRDRSGDRRRLLGLPAFSSFSRRGWTGWWHYAILGVVIGVVVLLLIFLAHGRFIFDSRVFLIFIAAGW